MSFASWPGTLATAFGHIDNMARGRSILDRAISVRFFRIIRSGQQETPFFERLLQIHATAADQRTQQINGIDFWCDKITRNGNMVSGRFCRVQSTNLPPRVSRNRRLEPLGVGEIGPHTIWQFDGTLAVLAIETIRNGLNLSNFLSYVRAMCDCRGYAYLPVLDDTALEAARAGRIRELAVRVATPRNLQTVAAYQRQMKQGMVDLMGPQIATQVEVKFSVRAGDPDIQERWFTRTVNWLRNERDADRGTISKLQARVVVDEDGHQETLNLLDSQLGTRRELDLPDDDPDRSAAIRLSNIADIFNAHLASLQRQFGQC
jgi:hypothetical protein